MHIWIVPFMALAVAGCDSATTKACEEFIKDGLASPSSYHRVSVTERIEPVTMDELHKLRPPDTFDEILEGERSLFLVGIEYDASNAYGANLRGGNVCAFEMRNGELPNNDIIKSKTRMSARTKSLRGMADQGIIPNVKPGTLGKPKKYDCCL